MARCSPSARASEPSWRSTVTTGGGGPKIVFSLGLVSVTLVISASGVRAHPFLLRQNRRPGRSGEARGESLRQCAEYRKCQSGFSSLTLARRVRCLSAAARECEICRGGDGF